MCARMPTGQQWTHSSAGCLLRAVSQRAVSVIIIIAVHNTAVSLTPERVCVDVCRGSSGPPLGRPQIRLCVRLDSISYTHGRASKSLAALLVQRQTFVLMHVRVCVRVSVCVHFVNVFRSKHYSKVVVSTMNSVVCRNTST